MNRNQVRGLAGISMAACLLTIWCGAWYLGTGVGSSHGWAEFPIFITSFVSGVLSIVLFVGSLPL